MKAIISAVLMFIVSLISAQKSEAKTSLEYLDLDNSLLWKIEGNNLQEPSYLFGTVHMICEEKFIMPKKLEEAISKIEQTYLEIDLTDTEEMTNAQKYMMAEETISSQISEEDFAYLDKAMKEKAGMGMQMLDNFEPFFVIYTYLQSSFPCPVKSFEMEIINLSEGKEIEGLSSVQEQFSYATELISANELVTYVKQLQEELFKQMFDELFEAYVQEDLSKIYDIFLQVEGSNPDMYKKLLVERNELWVERIPEIMEEKPTLFAIGAGHLVTTKGVIQLLRDKGYTVTAIE